ncbi:hypothetical protein EDB81DRAFT_884504 [Dactylonectria macrodidyma]|uniref:Uncharacterized protein n=1 Tax=Dactylonectria macrodidyma TaxID=307937 RepID=A0A9P9ETY7_9HYPO|nr:hypothetical protein EDB81DRAFT_884504 [Dactylonectria macrodidyma]
MADTSGTTYNEENGKLAMSDANEATFKEKYPKVAKYYELIFSEDLPAGGMVLEAGDDEDFRQQENRDSLEEDPFAIDSEDNGGDAATQIDGGEDDSDDNGSEDNVELLSSIPRTPVATGSSQKGKRARSSSQFSSNPGPSFSSKRKKVVAGNMTPDDMKELFPAETNHLHQVSKSVTGAEDLETAVSSCMRNAALGEEFRPPYAS